VEVYASKLRREIAEMRSNGKAKFGKAVVNVECPSGLKHIPDLIANWRIPENYNNSRAWKPVLTNKMAELAGNFTSGFIKSWLEAG
jgi:hypothetical protein